MAPIAGKYQLSKNENLTEFVTAFGLPADTAAKFNEAKPIMEFVVDGKKITINNDYVVKQTTLSFTLDAEFDDPMPHGESLKSIASLEGNKLVIKSKKADSQDAGSRIYEFSDKEVVCTMTAKSTPIVCKRYFSRV